MASVALSKQILRTKRLTFHYQMVADLGSCTDCVQHVLDSIKTDQLLVYRPDGQDIDDEPSVKVSLREWLPVAVNSIELQRMPKGQSGMYEANARLVLSSQGPGPCAWWGYIRIAESLRDRPKMIKSVLAHELAHGISHLPIIVPAFTDWRRFRAVVEYLGPILRTLVADAGTDLDNYGSPAGRAVLEQWWPNDLVDEWSRQMYGS